MRQSSRFAWSTLALLALAGPAAAEVRIVEVVQIGELPIVRTHQRELFVSRDSRGQRPLDRLGRLPRHSSPLVTHGSEAWSVVTGRGRNGDVQLSRVAIPGAGVLESFRAVPEPDLGPVEIHGIAGIDDDHVYLDPDLRFRKSDRALQRGHHPDEPGLEVLGTARSAGRTIYLTRDAQADPPILQLMARESGASDRQVRELGDTDRSARLLARGSDVFLVDRVGVLRYDGSSLRLVEDLGPMIGLGGVGFFDVSQESYWLQARPDAKGRAAPLQRIDRELLDGVAVQISGLPRGFEPAAVASGQIWFGTNRNRRAPLLSADAAAGTMRQYRIRGRHERAWRQFGEETGQALLVGAAVVTAPIWIPVLVASELAQ